MDDNTAAVVIVILLLTHSIFKEWVSRNDPEE
jgi:hypothetical protein